MNVVNSLHEALSILKLMGYKLAGHVREFFRNPLSFGRLGKTDQMLYHLKKWKGEGSANDIAEVIAVPSADGGDRRTSRSTAQYANQLVNEYISEYGVITSDNVPGEKALTYRVDNAEVVDEEIVSEEEKKCVSPVAEMSPVDAKNVTSRSLEMPVTPRQSQICSEMVRNPRTSAARLAHKLKVSVRTIRRDIATLALQGLIHHEGNTSAGMWCVGW